MNIMDKLQKVKPSIYTKFQEPKFINGTVTVIEYLKTFIIAFALTNANIFGNFSPFAVAFLSAVCLQGRVLPGVIGAFIGYFLTHPGLSGLKYIAACFLVLTISYITKDFKKSSRKTLMSLCASISLAISGFIFLVASAVSLSAVLLYICEMVIALCCTYFYMLALEPQKKDFLHFTGTMVLMATLLISIYNYTIFDILSPARIATVTIIMFITYLGGFTKGCSMGVAMGIIMDAASSLNPFFTCTYGFSALISGVFNQSTRVIFVCVYIVANATSSLLGIGDIRYLSGIYEVFLAGIIFVLLPDDLLSRFRDVLHSDPVKTSDYIHKVRNAAKSYANDTSAAFYELYLSMNSLSTKTVDAKTAHEEISAVFDAAAERVCKRCSVCNICWQKDYISTTNAFNDATNNMITNLRAQSDDFPSHFSSRCVKFEQLLIAINEGLTVLLNRKRYKEKIDENKSLISQQYSALTSIMRQISLNLGAGPEFMPTHEKRLKKYAEAFGQISYASFYKDGAGRMRAELCGRGTNKILAQREGFCSGLSAIMGVEFDLPEHVTDVSGSHLLFKQKAPFCVNIGIGVKSRNDNTVSGDSGTYFTTDDDKAYMIICDGMGSGVQAYNQSSAALRIIERFLRSSIHPLEALNTVTPAFKINSNNSSFVTIDIAMIDLFTGQCEVIKCGSGPSYVITNGKIHKIASSSMPLGINDSNPDITRFKMNENDILIMVSDGVCDNIDDDFLIRVIENNYHLTPKELSSKIILSAIDNDHEDDMTALVLKLSKTSK